MENVGIDSFLQNLSVISYNNYEIVNREDFVLISILDFMKYFNHSDIYVRIQTCGHLLFLPMNL